MVGYAYIFGAIFYIIVGVFGSIGILGRDSPIEWQYR